MNTLHAPGAAEPSVAVVSRQTSGIEGMRVMAELHGYTTIDLDKLARRAAWLVRWRSVGYDQRVEVAWSAIAEHLCTATERAEPDELVRVGARAIDREVEAVCRSHGVNVGRATSYLPKFHAYWMSVAVPPRSYEDRVLEPIALYQVWPQLRPYEQNALLALANSEGDHGQAAQRLGVPMRTLHTYLYRARQSFWRLWYAPETPTRKWDCDRPVRHERKGTITAITIRHRNQARRG